MEENTVYLAGPNLMEDSLEFDEHFVPLKRSAVPTLDDVKENDPLPEEVHMKREGTFSGPLTDVAKVRSDLPEIQPATQTFYDDSAIRPTEDYQPNDLDEAILRQKHMEQLTANEVFNDGGLDFLESKGSAITESELARQSLFVKFDPLVGARSCTTIDGSVLPTGVVSQKPPELLGSPAPVWNNGIKINPAFASQGHSATTNYIAAMQQKQQAMTKQQAAAKAGDSFHLINGPSVNGALLNGSGDYFRGEDDQSTNPTAKEQTFAEMAPPGSMVNLLETPQRPVALRVKNDGKTMTRQKMMNRRSVPAAFLESQLVALDVDLNQDLDREEIANLPDLPPVWENVIATYESLVQILVAKLQRYQDEVNDAKQKEARAVKEQEEMHRVFVGLHERFEATKAVANTYKANQETLQTAFDELNAEFQPLVLENKKMQATNRLHDMKVRQLETELQKRADENAELNKIVDDLISRE